MNNKEKDEHVIGGGFFLQNFVRVYAIYIAINFCMAISTCECAVEQSVLSETIRESRFQMLHITRVNI